jgi:hypothetical protein
MSIIIFIKYCYFEIMPKIIKSEFMGYKEIMIPKYYTFHHTDQRLKHLNPEFIARENTCRELTLLVELLRERISCLLKPDDRAYLKLYERYVHQLESIRHQINKKQSLLDTRNLRFNVCRCCLWHHFFRLLKKFTL